MENMVSDILGIISAIALEPMGFGVIKSRSAQSAKIESAIVSHPSFFSCDINNAIPITPRPKTIKMKNASEKSKCHSIIDSVKTPTPIRANESAANNTIPIFPSFELNMLLCFIPTAKKNPKVPVEISPKLKITDGKPHVLHRLSLLGLPPISDR